ncbi:hypothetical protein HOY82DRAFT_549569 [Tuber indicum]|nr:hypothetical protein HOY82DRAFT_549569 [Tuber indicum]
MLHDVPVACDAREPYILFVGPGYRRKKPRLVIINEPLTLLYTFRPTNNFTMLSRRYTISSSSPSPPSKTKSRVRRAKSTSYPTATRSELLAPQERSQQAVAAAQRAYGDDIQRRNSKREHAVFRSSGIRFLSPVDNRNRTSDAGGFYSVNRHEAEKSHSTMTKNASYASYDTAAGASYSTYASRENTASMRLGTLRQLGDENEVFQQLTFSSPGARRALNLSDLGADYHSSPGSPVPSTPSSYRRLRKTKSVFSVSQVYPRPTPDQSPAVFPPELSSKEAMMRNQRKSTSFLRGGTEFMPDSMRHQLEEAGGDGPSQRQQQQSYVKEQKPFYLSASCRRSQKPIAFPETVRAKKVSKEQPTELLSVRKAMGETAKKVFGSMKRVFGVREKLENTFPEQHVPASRSHFCDFVSPSELHDDIKDIPEPGIIRMCSNIVSRAPTLRTVPSFEMPHSIAGSIRDVTPNPPQSPVSTIRGVSVPTDGSSTWNSTLDRRSASKRLSIIDENAPDRIRENLYEPSVAGESTQPRYEVRRVYSALMKRLDEGAANEPQDCQKDPCGPGYGSPESGCHMAPGLGLKPEEENLFTKPGKSGQGRSTTTSTIRKSAAQKWGHLVETSRDKNPDPFYIPSVPQIPILYSPIVHKTQNIDSITAGWREAMEGADEEQMRLIAALRALSPVPSISRESEGKGTQNGRSSATISSITPPGTHTPLRRLRQTSSINFLPSPTKVPSGETALSRCRRPGSMGMLRTKSTPATPPPPLRPPPSPPNISSTSERSAHDRDDNSVVVGEKPKIRGKLRMKDYCLNTTSAENGSKLRVYSGNQGLGLESNRSALAERTSRDIENAVNSQFGPVINRRASKTSVRVGSLESSAAFI